jgi:hypothetical protein
MIATQDVENALEEELRAPEEWRRELNRDRSRLRAYYIRASQEVSESLVQLIERNDPEDINLVEEALDACKGTHSRTHALTHSPSKQTSKRANLAEGEASQPASQPASQQASQAASQPASQQASQQASLEKKDTPVRHKHS